MARTVPKDATARMEVSAIRSMASARVRRDGPVKSANRNVNQADLDRIVRRAAIAIWRIRWLAMPRPGSASARQIGAVSAARVAVRWDCTVRAVPRFALATTILPAIR